MKPYAILCLLVACAFIGLSAQPWRPITLGETHHFRSDTANFFPDRSIRVDSVTANPGDTAWHLTRYMEPISWDSALKNLPGFCQRRMHVLPGGWYNFRSPGNIAVHATAAPGQSWLLDSMLNITGTVQSVRADSVLGQPDSLKTILLTWGDSLVLSRSHGIVDWPAALGAGHFRLVGLQAQSLGERYPTWAEWFPYQAGQQFFWDSYQAIADPQTNYYYQHSKVVVDSVHWSAGGVHVYYSGMREQGTQGLSGPINWGLPVPQSGVFAVYDTAASPFHALHKEGWDAQGATVMVYDDPMVGNFLFAEASEGIAVSYPFAMYMSSLLRMRLSVVDSALVLEAGTRGGGWPDTLGTYGGNGSDTVWSSNLDLMYYRIRAGLGLEEIRNAGFEDISHAQLVGYITLSGDSVGTVWRNWFTVGAEEETALNMEAYPNPTGGRLRVEVPVAEPWSLELLDVRGLPVQTAKGEAKVHDLDLTGLPAGIYLLRLDQGGISANRRLVIAR